MFVAAVWALVASLVPRPSSLAYAQAPDLVARVRAQRDTLEKIRQERAALERRMNSLQANVHSLSDEVANLDARAAATQHIVQTLQAELAAIADEVNDASSDLARTQDELAMRRAAMNRRLVDIYKRGPLFTLQVLLSANSFGELVARYKYLHLLALHDRALVQRVEQLRDHAALQRNRLVTLQNDLVDSRNDKQQEESRLRDLQREQASRLQQAKHSAAEAGERLARLRRTESQLTNAIATFEAARRRLERARPNAARTFSSIRTSDYGRLDWPVQGPLLYTYGKAQTASNTTIRWNGVGIAAPVGSPVHAVAAGTVVSVRQLGTYGLTIIVDHGGGDYSIYGSLSAAEVHESQHVAKGQVLGATGISDPDLPAHLHFEIRHGGPAVDPATWLRHRR